MTLAVKSTDRFGRTVAEVLRADGRQGGGQAQTNLKLALVEAGQAFVYLRYLGSCKAQRYLDAEARARRRRAGVWQPANGITRPWDFRRSQRH